MTKEEIIEEIRNRNEPVPIPIIIQSQFDISLIESKLCVNRSKRL